MNIPQTALVRHLNRWDLTALVVNGIIGSGIFGLPAIIITLTGAASPLTYLAAAAGTAVVVVCFAGVGALFSDAGGPYLYAREAFGPFVGLQIGWIAWLARMTGAGANANLFTLYLGELWAPARTDWGRLVSMTFLIGVLAIINYRGVRKGALVSDLFVLAKLLPLALFVGIGLFFLRGENFHLTTGVRWGGFSQAVLLLIFAFGGFENAAFPASEARQPKRDLPFALLAGLGVVTVFYLLIQVVVQGTLPPGTETERPLATAARQFLGAPGAWLLSAGALVSVIGWFSGTLLSLPRLTFAMGERGDLPAFFAAIHPRFRTPHVSILIFSALSWALAMAGTFQWNAALSAAARLFVYGTTCAALPVFGKRTVVAGRNRAVRGTVLGLAGVAFCALLLPQMGWTLVAVLAGTMSLAAATWVWNRRPVTH